jgi:tetratricopeptide (TPR) repeat protein
MYIKRSPLGQGNLAFGKRRKRLPLLGIIAYLLVLAGALFIFFNMDTVQPKVLAALGPSPMPTASPAELITKGDEAYHAGNYEDALIQYEQAAALVPTDLDVMFMYARLLTFVGRLQDAVAVADQMILSAPEDPRGYAARARALDWMEEYNQAQIEALRAIEVAPDYALGHAYLAEAYADLGSFRQAREQAELALLLDPYHVDVRRNYAYVLEYYGDYNGAIQQYVQALQLEPNMLDLWYGLARNYRGAGNMEKSIETYAEIAKRTPEDPYLYVEWGKTYFEMREDGLAQETLQQAVFLVCDKGQADAGIEETERQDCPFLDSTEIIDERGDWYVDPGKTPRDNQIPWDADNRDVPPQVLMSAWNRLGQVYLTRRNYEDVVAILAEAIAWGEAQEDPTAEGYQEVPIESYYVLASAYYYMDECHFAVPLAVDALNKYERDKMDDPNALKTILTLFVLCRDWAGSPETTVVHTGPGFGEDGFPDGYAEPDVLIERGDSTDDDAETEENTNDNTDN